MSQTTAENTLRSKSERGIKKSLLKEQRSKKKDNLLAKKLKQQHTESSQPPVESEIQPQPSPHACSPELLTASLHGDVKEVDRLLNTGIDIDQQDSKGATALIVASRQGHLEVVKLLLSKGAEVNKQKSDGKSALRKASRRGHIEVVKLLLENGAEANIKDNYGATALMVASLYNHGEIVNCLLQNEAMLNLQTNNGNSALICASVQEDPQVAKQLIEHGADVNMVNTNEITALLYAAYHDRSEVAQLLLENGAAIDVQDCDGECALTIATKRDSTDTVAVLLANGAKINIQEKDGFTALMYACNALNLELVEVLLNHGAQVDLQDEDGLSAVMIAIQNSQIEHIQAMLQKGARVDIQNNLGQSPFLMACMLGFKPIIDLLIEYGAQIDLQDNDGKSSLIHTVESAQTDLSIFLIEMGAQVNIQDKKGWCPLMYAAKAGDLEAIQLLVAYGASTHTKNNEGKTIFDICSQEIKYTPIIQELFQTFLTTVNEDLRLESKYPGIVFFKPPIIGHLSSSSCELDHLDDAGISLSIPDGSLCPDEEPLELAIHTCFSGPFKLPRKYRSASPAYLICPSRKVDFQKEITVKFRHYLNLRSEDECSDMVFLSASSTPEYKGSRPLYIFKRIRNAKVVFKPGDQVGEIALQHFCVIKAGVKRTREDEGDSEKKHKDNQHHLYSARLYRNLEHKGLLSAVFCICLIHPMYIKHCNNNVISQYTGMADKGGWSEVYAEIDGEEVTVYPDQQSSFIITFDKKPTKILKRDIHLPELINIDVQQLTNYPPRLLIYVQQISPEFSPPEVQVVGLDRKCSFELEVLPQSPLPLSASDHESSKEPPLCTGSPLRQLQPVHEIETVSPQALTVADATSGKTVLQSPQSTAPPPSLRSLMLIKWHEEGFHHEFRLVDRVSIKWRKFGLLLDLKPNTLDGWNKQFQADSGDCWVQVMQHWMDGGSKVYPATWQGLYDLVEDVGYPAVAKELKEAVEKS